MFVECTVQELNFRYYIFGIANVIKIGGIFFSLENGNYSSLHELNSFPVLDGLWQNSPKEFILFAG